MIGRITIVFRLLCDLQRLCIHTAIASLRFSLALRPSAHSNLWIAHRPRCAACSDLSIAFQPLAVYGQAHMLSILRLAHRPRCAARQRASIMAISPFSLWLAAFRLLSSYTQLVCAHSDCVIVFQRSLAAMRSLDSLGHLRGTLRSAIGVRPQRLHTCIQAWPCGQALSLYPLAHLPPALHGVKRFAHCISAWPYGQAHSVYPLARSPPVLRGASTCLIQL